MLPLTTLLTYGVGDEAGQVFGKVDNLLVDLAGAGVPVPYVLVALGQGVASNDQLYPVPPNVLQLRREQQAFVFVGDPERLRQAPYLTRSGMSTRGNVTLPAEVHPFWAAGNLETAGAAGQAQPGRDAEGLIVPASQLIGFGVWHRPDEQLGTLQDAIVDLAAGRLPYFVVALEDALQPTKRLVVAPSEALSYDAGQQVFLLAVERSVLDGAPSFADDSWPDLSDPSWDQEVRSFWADKAPSRTGN
jgi:hypothetical protein